MIRKSVAIFVDAGFFNRKFFRLVDPKMQMPPEQLAKKMWSYWVRHVDRRIAGEQLYRIFYYDCPPLDIKAHHPLLNKQVDFSKSNISQYKNALHAELRRQPYVACRMGTLSVDANSWGFIKTDNRVHNFKKLIRGEVDVSQVNAKNVSLRPIQKGVDMRLGIDITSIVLKRLANKVVLISGDSDFVPAAKLARVEGAHVILDAMGRKVGGGLEEHIDGLKTFVHQLAADDYSFDDE